jgi:hypothetical protein
LSTVRSSRMKIPRTSFIGCSNLPGPVSDDALHEMPSRHPMPPTKQGDSMFKVQAGRMTVSG